jgi:hypothetical protein
MLSSTDWDTPSLVSQAMTATQGGSLQADPSVINPARQVAIKASVFRETILDLENGKKFELLDPASVIYTTNAGADPKSNRLTVTVLGKQPISVDVSNLHSVSSKGSKILVGLETYTIRCSSNGSLEPIEDRRNRPWSDLLTKSSPF